MGLNCSTEDSYEEEGHSTTTRPPSTIQLFLPTKSTARRVSATCPPQHLKTATFCVTSRRKLPQIQLFRLKYFSQKQRHIRGVVEKSIKPHPLRNSTLLIPHSPDEGLEMLVVIYDPSLTSPNLIAKDARRYGFLVHSTESVQPTQDRKFLRLLRDSCFRRTKNEFGIVPPPYIQPEVFRHSVKSQVSAAVAIAAAIAEKEKINKNKQDRRGSGKETKSNSTQQHQLPIDLVSTPPSKQFNTCPHPYVEAWKLNQCSTCGNIVSRQQAMQEQLLAAKIMKEDRDAVTYTNKSHALRQWERGVRVDWLVAFTFAHDCWNWPTWKVVKDIIKPATEHHGRCRYTDLPSVKPFTGGVQVFVSHTWKSTWGTLVAAVVYGVFSLSTRVYVDIFSVRQWPGNAADVNFASIIAHPECQDVLVVLPTSEIEADKATIPFYRLWCIVEIACAVELDKNITVMGGRVVETPLHDAQEHVSLRTSSMEASTSSSDNHEVNWSSYENSNMRSTIQWSWGGVDLDEILRSESFFIDIKNAYVYNTIGTKEALEKLVNVDVMSAECAVQADYDREMKRIDETVGMKKVEAAIAKVVNDAKESGHIQFASDMTKSSLHMIMAKIMHRRTPSGSEGGGGGTKI